LYFSASSCAAQNVLDTVGYETHILRSAKKLIYHDLYKLVNNRHLKQARAMMLKENGCGMRCKMLLMHT
jgi:hypothetical protein